MTTNARKTAEQIIEMLRPALRETNGKYETEWGQKTLEGLIASVETVLQQDQTR